ncbi:MAG TPA: PaaI family thioesterase [Acidimicrobiales bacterium]|nr:PaaI family thioesterase [Acidimicrobiales bacterium]
MTDPVVTPAADPAAVLAQIPFGESLGMSLDSATPDEVRGTMPWREVLCTGAGLMHGGALMTFADTLGAVCAFLNLPPGAGTSTIESKTNLFRGVRGGVVSGTATPLHVGRTTIVVQTDVRDEAGKRVALVTQTQAVLTR